MAITITKGGNAPVITKGASETVLAAAVSSAVEASQAVTGMTAVTGAAGSEVNWDIPTKVLTVPRGDTGAIGVGGLISTKTITTTHSVSLLENVLLCDASSGAFTVTLPDPSACYDGVNLTTIVYTIGKIDSSANIVTIATLGAETIGGDASFDLIYINEALELGTDGTNWYIKG